MRIILVHGGGHGAWCWYKVVAELKSGGYSVSTLDLAACGADPRRMPEDVSSFAEYAQPLIDLVAAAPDGEKLVLVGHSFAGMSLASAMEAFPHKIAVTVFITAIVPDTTRAPWYIVEEHVKRSPTKYEGMEIKSISLPGKSQPFDVIVSDLEQLATNLYQKCSPEDLALASTMVRPGSFFREDLEKLTFSEARYGSVNTVFIVCGEDAMLTKDFQKWMIENGGVKEVMEIEEADHMAMLSKPKELCQCLISIFNKYAE